MIDRGTGAPLVLIPGIQGRWEWMEPTVRALSAHFRVLTSSLAGEPGSEVASAEPAGFERQATLVDRLLERAMVDHAIVVGVSFGGLVAAYAAASRPERVSALVLASTPGPSWAPDAKTRRYAAWPRLMAPAFVAGAPWRLGPEIVAARKSVRDRTAFAIAQATRVARSPMRIGLTAARLRLMTSPGTPDWCRRISAPTLVLTGEPHLDRVVPVMGSREYVQAVAGATLAVMAGTGHLGCVSRPDEFADIVWTFVSTLTTKEPGAS